MALLLHIEPNKAKGFKNCWFVHPKTKVVKQEIEYNKTDNEAIRRYFETKRGFKFKLNHA